MRRILDRRLDVALLDPAAKFLPHDWSPPEQYPAKSVASSPDERRAR